MGPWAGQKIQVTRDWYLQALEQKIKIIDWPQTVQDVAPFLKAQEQKSLALWGPDFFLDKVSKLETILLRKGGS